MLQFNKMIYSNFTYFCENIQTLQGLRETACAPFIVSALITSTVPKWFSQGQKLQNISQNAYSQSNYANFFGCIWETRHSKLCFHKSTEYFSANRSLTAGHFSLQISPILRRNPHRRVQLGVICLALTVKHEVSKSIS